MAGIVKKVDTVTADLAKREKRTRDVKPLLKQIGVYVSRNAVQESFKKQSSPDGTKWKPLAKQTVSGRRGSHQKKRKPGKFKGKILQDKAILKQSITFEIGKDEVTVGTNVKYAARHQFGFQGVRGPNGFARGRGPTPARPFLMDANGNLSKEADEVIEDMIEEYLFS